MRTARDRARLQDALDQQQAHEAPDRQDGPPGALPRPLDAEEGDHEAQDDRLLVVGADAEREGDGQELDQEAQRARLQAGDEAPGQPLEENDRQDLVQGVERVGRLGGGIAEPSQQRGRNEQPHGGARGRGRSCTNREGTRGAIQPGAAAVDIRAAIVAYRRESASREPYPRAASATPAAARASPQARAACLDAVRAGVVGKGRARHAGSVTRPGCSLSRRQRRFALRWLPGRAAPSLAQFRQGRPSMKPSRFALAFAGAVAGLAQPPPAPKPAKPAAAPTTLPAPILAGSRPTIPTRRSRLRPGRRRTERSYGRGEHGERAAGTSSIAGGTVVEIEEEVPSAQLPAPVTAALKAQYPAARSSKGKKVTAGRWSATSCRSAGAARSRSS